MFDRLFFQYAIEVADPDASTFKPPQELFDAPSRECSLDRAFEVGELVFLLNLDDSLFETHRQSPASKFWSGRRESNPRPTAWKAVTLPLSYSRKTQLSAFSCQALQS